MDAHLRYFQQVYMTQSYAWYIFKFSLMVLHIAAVLPHENFLLQGYQLFQQMEPFISEVCSLFFALNLISDGACTSFVI